MIEARHGRFVCVDRHGVLGREEDVNVTGQSRGCAVRAGLACSSYSRCCLLWSGWESAESSQRVFAKKREENSSTEFFRYSYVLANLVIIPRAASALGVRRQERVRIL